MTADDKNLRSPEAPPGTCEHGICPSMCGTCARPCDCARRSAEASTEHDWRFIASHGGSEASLDTYSQCARCGALKHDYAHHGASAVHYPLVYKYGEAVDRSGPCLGLLGAARSSVAEDDGRSRASAPLGGPQCPAGDACEHAVYLEEYKRVDAEHTAQMRKRIAELEAAQRALRGASTEPNGLRFTAVEIHTAFENGRKYEAAQRAPQGASTAEEAWRDLHDAAEDFVKGYDGPGTAGDAESRLRAAAIAYAAPRSGSAQPDDAEKALDAIVRMAPDKAASEFLAYRWEFPTEALAYLLQERERSLQAKVDVLGGEWCAKNRAEGRGGCGMCAWCCKRAHDRAEAAELRLRTSAASSTTVTDAQHDALLEENRRLYLENIELRSGLNKGADAKKYVPRCFVRQGGLGSRCKYVEGHDGDHSWGAATAEASPCASVDGPRICQRCGDDVDPEMYPPGKAIVFCSDDCEATFTRARHALDAQQTSGPSRPVEEHNVEATEAVRSVLRETSARGAVPPVEGGAALDLRTGAAAAVVVPGVPSDADRVPVAVTRAAPSSCDARAEKRAAAFVSAMESTDILPGGTYKPAFITALRLVFGQVYDEVRREAVEACAQECLTVAAENYNGMTLAQADRARKAADRLELGGDVARECARRIRAGQFTSATRIKETKR